MSSTRRLFTPAARLIAPLGAVALVMTWAGMARGQPAAWFYDAPPQGRHARHVAGNRPVVSRRNSDSHIVSPAAARPRLDRPTVAPSRDVTFTSANNPAPYLASPPDPACNDCDRPPGYGPAYGEARYIDPLWAFWQHARQRGHWLHRPLSAGWFVGVLWGDDLRGLDFANNPVGQNSGFFGGLRIGWDWTNYFGGETRLGFSSVDLQDSLSGLNNDVILWDGDLLFYPTGDTRLRPYLLTGLGLANFDIGTDGSRRLLSMPIGVGVKYRVGNRAVLRLQVIDNIAFPSGSGLQTTHNPSLTGGMEFRFGGTRRSY